MYGDRRFANSISDENIGGMAECDDLKWNVGLVQPYSLLPLENEAMADRVWIKYIKPNHAI